MSLEMLSAVWDLELERNERDVLEVLAWHANADGLCWPSKARIMYRTGLSESTVKRALASLRKQGLITVEQHAEGGRGRVPIYRLHPEKGVKKPPFEEWKRRKGAQGEPLQSRSKGGQPDTERGSYEREKGVRAVTPEPTENLHKEPSVYSEERESSYESSLSSGEAAFRGSPARGERERPKAKDAKQYAVGRLMDFVAEAKASGRRPAPPDEPFKRRNADIFAAHLADGYEVEELEEALRVQVRYACGEGEGRYAGKRRWIPFVDALEIAGGRNEGRAEEGLPAPPRQEFAPSPPEAIAAIREHDYLRRYASVAERWDFTAEEEPPFKILARIGGDEEERWRNLERLRSVARRAVREAAA